MKITLEYICPEVNETVEVDPNINIKIGYHIHDDYYSARIKGVINTTAVATIEKCIKCGFKHEYILSAQSEMVE